MKLRALMLLGLCIASSAQAGLFTDDDARKLSQENQKAIQQLETRLQKLEETNNQQTRSMLDLQSQIEALNGEIRKLRGQNEELTHALGDAEKRAKDFYVDLDTRVRHFESEEEAAKSEAAPASGVSAASAQGDASELASEDRDFEGAYGLFKSGQYPNAVKAFHEFLKKHPGSAHVPNANYWLGSAKLALKDYKGALASYQNLLKISPNTPKAADAMFNIAECQDALKQPAAAKKTLKELIAKYPASDAAGKAKKLLAAGK